MNMIKNEDLVEIRGGFGFNFPSIIGHAVAGGLSGSFGGPGSMGLGAVAGIAKSIAEN